MSGMGLATPKAAAKPEFCSKASFRTVGLLVKTA